MANKKQFSNTKSIVKVETGIVTLISYHHYLKIVGNNKLWTHMQKESWNIHGTKILICSITLNWTESQPSLEQKRNEGYVIVSTMKYVSVTDVHEYVAFVVIFHSFPFMTCHRIWFVTGILTWVTTTGDTSGGGIAYPSGAPGF